MYSIGKRDAKKWLKFLLFLSIAVVINIIFKSIAITYVPDILYLDTIGTMLVAMVGGYFPSVLVALISNILSVYIAPRTVYYVILNVIIAVITAFFFSKYKHSDKKIWHIIQFVLVSALVFCILGTAITYALGTYNIEQIGGNSVYISRFMDATGLKFGIACFIVNFWTAVIDKGICVVGALILYIYMRIGSRQM